MQNDANSIHADSVTALYEKLPVITGKRVPLSKEIGQGNEADKRILMTESNIIIVQASTITKVE